MLRVCNAFLDASFKDMDELGKCKEASWVWFHKDVSKYQNVTDAAKQF